MVYIPFHIYVLLTKFKKLILWISLGQHGLQILEVSRDLEKLVYKVVETPWITPCVYLNMKYIYFNQLVHLKINSINNNRMK